LFSNFKDNTWLLLAFVVLQWCQSFATAITLGSGNGGNLHPLYF
jgi:hypothetical protein